MAGKPDREPSMEDILSSIRRIITEDEAPPAAPAEPSPAEEVLELTEPLTEAPAPESPLSALQVSGYPGADNTLEALVRSLLRPMLQQWLDANLPRIVEEQVTREVRRLMGR